MRRALALALLLVASPAAAQDLFERAITPGAAQVRRDAARAQHLEFLAGLPARFLDLFAASPTRAERDALRLEALRLVERALVVTPEDPALLGTAAALRERLGDPERALRDVDRALALAPDGPDASDLLFTRALLRTRRGDHAGTRDDYLRALRFPLSDSTRGTVLGNLADTWLALGDTARAVETYASCVHHAPDYALGWLGLAIAQDRQGDAPWEAAAEALRVASAHAQGRPEALLDELSRDGVFFVPPYDRYTYEAMAWAALARAEQRGEVAGADAATIRRHRGAARAAWEAWRAAAPADDRWQNTVQRHLLDEPR
ncbi:MAG: tetratricopeptide repeat protein [Polyangiales bacterium]